MIHIARRVALDISYDSSRAQLHIDDVNFERSTSDDVSLKSLRQRQSAGYTICPVILVLVLIPDRWRERLLSQ